MATEIIELYKCETHGFVRWFRFEMGKAGEGQQLCPYCDKELEIIDIDEARKLEKKQNEEN